MQLFRSATMRLTAWYMLILTVLCLLFSFIVYSIGAYELQRPARPIHNRLGVQVDTDIFEQFRLQQAQESMDRLVSDLIIFNIAALAAGGMASYWLAKQTLQPIEAALESQSRFSSDAAHELRTPLSVMQSEIEVALRAKQTSRADLHSILESNLDEVHRLRGLTDRLLMLASDKEFQLEETDLEDIAIDAVGHVISLAQSKRIRIDNSVASAIITAHPESMVDAIVILLENAIKYSPAKSVIGLTSKKQGKNIYISVKDSGIGIEAKDRPHIFDRFYRADTSRSKLHVEGHGLGLSIAQRIVDSHNGKIVLASKPGRGSTFTIILPRA